MNLSLESFSREAEPKKGDGEREVRHQAGENEMYLTHARAPQSIRMKVSCFRGLFLDNFFSSSVRFQPSKMVLTSKRYKKKKYYRFNHNELDIILICFCLTAKISQNRFFLFLLVLQPPPWPPSPLRSRANAFFSSLVFFFSCVSFSLLSSPIRSVSVLLLLRLGDRRAIKRS